MALVDPELARAARALLPDRPRFGAYAAVPVLNEQAAFVERLRDDVAARDLGRPRRRGRLVAAAGLIGLGAVLTLLIGRERGPAPIRQQTQSVVRTVSPAPATTKPATSAARHAPTLPGQAFVWVPTAGASAYEFQLFQGGERIYRARVAKPRLELPGRWRQDGRPHALLPGDYRWYVWPVSSRTKRQAPVATVQAKLVVERQSR